MLGALYPEVSMRLLEHHILEITPTFAFLHRYKYAVSYQYTGILVALVVLTGYRPSQNDN